MVPVVLLFFICSCGGGSSSPHAKFERHSGRNLYHHRKCHLRISEPIDSFNTGCAIADGWPPNHASYFQRVLFLSACCFIRV